MEWNTDWSDDTQMPRWNNDCGPRWALHSRPLLLFSFCKDGLFITLWCGGHRGWHQRHTSMWSHSPTSPSLPLPVPLSACSPHPLPQPPQTNTLTASYLLSSVLACHHLPCFQGWIKLSYCWLLGSKQARPFWLSVAFWSWDWKLGPAFWVSYC